MQRCRIDLDVRVVLDSPPDGLDEGFMFVWFVAFDFAGTCSGV